MAFERTIPAVAPTAFTADGSAFGVVTVADTIGVKVKQIIVLCATGLPPLSLQVKRVLSATQFIVGPNGLISPDNFKNISAYTLAAGAYFYAQEQNKANIPDADHYKAIYEMDPTVADRVIPVDPYGNLYGPDNPIPVQFDGTIEASVVEIKGSPSGDLLNVNADGSINVNIVETPVTGQTVRSIYNQVLTVAANATVTLVAYTVPIGYTAILERANASGDNIGRYDILYNSALFDTRRTMFGSDLTTDFDYTTGTSNGLALNSGDVVIIQVTNPRPNAAAFNARIQVLEIA